MSQAPAESEAQARVVTDDYAREFVKRGWRVHPCKPLDDADPKAPWLPHGFHDASSDANDISRWWGNYPDALIGYVPASGGHVVIDCLPGVDVADLPAEWQETRQVRTPNGLHVYFAAQPGVEYGNGPRPDLRSQYPDIIDCIRHADGYVIIPPSPGYRLINNVEPLAAPSCFAVPAGGSSTRDIFGGNSRQMDDRDVITWNDQEDAVKDRALFQARLRPRPTENEATAAVWQFIQDRCPNQPGRPPWTEADARRKVQRAFAADITHPIQVDARPPVDPDQLGRTAAELLAEQPEQVDWILPGFIAAGQLTKLAGREKTGKGTLAFYLLAAAERGDACVLGETRQTTALIVTEEPPQAVREKAAKFGLACARIIYGRELAGMDWPAKVDALVQAAVAHGHGIIFMDNISRAAAVEDENGTELARRLEVLMDAAAAHGIAVLVDHHHRKMGGSVFDKSRGGTAAAGACDVNVELLRMSQSDPTDRRRKLVAIGRLDAACWERIVTLMDGGDYVDSTAAQEAFSAPTGARQWLHYLDGTRRSQAVTARQIMDTHDVAKQTAHDRMQQLVEAGLAGTDKPGLERVWWAL